MRSFFFCTVFLAACFLSCNEPRHRSNTLKGKPFRHLEYYSENGVQTPLQKLVKEEFAAGRIPILHFSATWCGPCRKFEAALSDSLMIDALSGVTLISIDIDNDAAGEKWSAKYKVEAVPTYVRVDSLCNAEKIIDSGEWDEDLPEYIAPVFRDFVNGND